MPNAGSCRRARRAAPPSPERARPIAYFICPNCKYRVIDADGREGLSHQAVGCHRCGFGFLFQLLEDYIPHPNAGCVACDQGARVLSSGQGVFELTGRSERDMLGDDVRAALRLSFPDGDPVATCLEWGVRQLGKPATVVHIAGHTKAVLCDIFPAYDDDGGLLVVVSPAD